MNLKKMKDFVGEDCFQLSPEDVSMELKLEFQLSSLKNENIGIDLQCTLKNFHPIKSPFERWSEPTSEEILTLLEENTIVIYTDGSTKPEPGIGGAGLVIQDPEHKEWLELEFPIKGITTNVGSELEAVRQALEYV